MTPFDHASASPGVTVRIAFDGAPYAGKTTALRALGESLGEHAISKEEDDDGRTLWFDWMAHSGGLHDGKPIRAEVVTVPGQTDLVDRRRHLIEWSDVVVFVIDSQPTSLAESASKFAALRQDFDVVGARPVVVIANKRDVPGAVPLETLRAHLGLDADEPLIETVATTGGGIRQAFVFAVRAAIRQDPTRTDATDPDELRGSMDAVSPAEIDATPIEATATETTAQAPATERLLLDRDAAASGGAFLVDATEWRFIVSVAGGQVAVPTAGTPDAAVADRLLDAGLLVRQSPHTDFGRPSAGTPDVASIATSHRPLARRPVNAAPARGRRGMSDAEVERHRALLELRRSIRGY